MLLALAFALSQELALGRWRASLASPGGELRFFIDVERDASEDLHVFLVNPPERIEVPQVSIEAGELVLDMPHYDSTIRAKIAKNGDELAGTWTKRSGAERWTRMGFAAYDDNSFCKLASPGGIDVTGRWAVRFASEPDSAVAIFDSPAEVTYLGSHGIVGTILTATGDYRYLSGTFNSDTIELSVFDGAHAFLFKARMNADGSLAGDFWSGTSWHDTWTAVRDENAALPDDFAQTSWSERAALADLVFPDLDGVPRSLADPAFAGRAIVLQLFGSWCPNCHDEAKLLTDLDRTYRERGLSILGLAFEHTGEFARDAEQVRRYATRHGIEYPLFVVGSSDKEQASAAFPAIDRVRAFPTTIFLSGDGRVRAVHSGFAGPATGVEHVKLVAHFERLIEELLAEEPPSDGATWTALTAQPWYDYAAFAGGGYVFRLNATGAREVFHQTFGSGRPVIGEETLPVALAGDAVTIGERTWRFDRAAGVLVDPRSFNERLAPRDHIAPLLAERGYLKEAGALRALADPDPLVRREALVALTHLRQPDSKKRLAEMLPLLQDPNFGVRLACAWAAGRCQEPDAREWLLANLADPNAALRRESVLALTRMATRDESLRGPISTLENDPDPLVRAAVAGALTSR